MIDDHHDAAEYPIPQHLRVRRRDAPDFQNVVTRLLKQIAQALEREEPRVRAVQDAFSPIVELPDEQHEPRHEKGDVRRGQHDFRALVLGAFAQLFHENFRVFEVLDDV